MLSYLDTRRPWSKNQQRSGVSDESSLIAAARDARQAGCEVFEPVLAEAGAMSVGADEASLRRAGEVVRGEGLSRRSTGRENC